MKLIFLGTGDAAGTPKIGCLCASCADAKKGGRSRRFRPCILFSDGKTNVLADTGPDLRSQLIENNIPKVDAVVWTHAHRDHYAGFGDFWRVKNNMPVYGEKRVLDPVLGEFHFMTFERHDVELYEPFFIGEMEMAILEVSHPPLEFSTGLRVRHNGKTVIYTGDTNLDIPEKSLEAMKGADLLIADAIFPPGMRVHKHMNAEDALKLCKSLEAKECLFIHLSHMYPPHDEAIKNFPLACDGMIREL